MIERLPGEMPTISTRAEAEKEVDKQKRYRQILECFKARPRMSAKECAVEMFQRGWIPTSERNYAAPRFTELSQKGIIEPIGKAKCPYTGKTVAVYEVRQ